MELNEILANSCLTLRKLEIFCDILENEKGVIYKKGITYYLLTKICFGGEKGRKNIYRTYLYKRHMFYLFNSAVKLNARALENIAIIIEAVLTDAIVLGGELDIEDRKVKREFLEINLFRLRNSVFYYIAKYIINYPFLWTLWEVSSICSILSSKFLEIKTMYMQVYGGEREDWSKFLSIRVGDDNVFYKDSSSECSYTLPEFLANNICYGSHLIGVKNFCNHVNIYIQGLSAELEDVKGMETRVAKVISSSSASGFILDKRGVKIRKEETEKLEISRQRTGILYKKMLAEEIVILKDIYKKKSSI